MFATVRKMLATETIEAVKAAREAKSIFSELAAAMPEAFEDRLHAVQELLRELGETSSD